MSKFEHNHPELLYWLKFIGMVAALTLATEAAILFLASLFIR